MSNPEYSPACPASAQFVFDVIEATRKARLSLAVFDTIIIRPEVLRLLRRRWKLSGNAHQRRIKNRSNAHKQTAFGNV